MIRTPPIDMMEAGRKDTGKDPFKKSARLIRSPPSTSVSAVFVENTPECRTTLANRVPFDVETNTQAVQSEEVIMFQNFESTPQTTLRRTEIGERLTLPRSTMETTLPTSTLRENTQKVAMQPAHVEIVDPPSLLSSPRQEFILKMRRAEEETLIKCQNVIRRIRAAMGRQKNISMDVKNGVSELEELLDIMKSYRGNWKAAEKEKETSRKTLGSKESENNSTPVSSMGKRGASSSPAEKRPGKKAREKELEVTTNTGERVEGEWRTVKSKKTIQQEKTQRRKMAKQRPEAVIIHPKEGRSYSDVLKNIRGRIKPEESEIAISTIRKTKTGAILIEMGKGGRRDEFKQSLKNVLGQEAVVKDLTPMVKLDIRDLDALTTPEEVFAVVRRETDVKETDITIHMTEANTREQRRAFVSIPDSCAYKLLKSRRIKIGLTNCRITIREELVRCFRCFGVGHRQWNCNGPDRKGMGLCIKCGETGHRKKDCRNAPKCCICSTESGRGTDRGPRPIRTGKGSCHVWMQFERVTLMSCYLTPSDDIRSFEEKLGKIEDAIMQIGGNFIVAGDFNSRAVEWGMETTNSRGNRIVEMAARTGLIFANVGSVSTFRRPGCEGTIPDITMVTERICHRIINWRVLEVYTGSDHQYISYALASGNAAGTNTVKRNNRRWDARKLDANTLIAEIDRLCQNKVFSGDARTRVTQTMGIIKRGCTKAMPLTRPPNIRRKAVYWWDDNIAALRRGCLRLRRIYTRARRRGSAVEEALAFREARKTLREAILRKKTQAFEELRNDLNQDPYGLGYKIVMDKLIKRKPVEILEERVMENIVDTLFPTHVLENYAEDNRHRTEFIPFTAHELSVAAAGLKPGKAPGPDGIPAEVLREIARKRPGFLLDMYNACLKEYTFPEIWKRQQLVLISKGRGDPEDPSSYRPLCMLDTAGKLLERLIKPRLAAAIENGGGLSNRQFGFRPGRSTIGALTEVMEAARTTQKGNHYTRPIVLLATLDVKNAFNSLRWSDIVRSLEVDFSVPQYILRMVKSYLSDRQLIFDIASGRKVRPITSGAAQGSILGPDLWNASYNGILQEEMPEGTFLVGYADDLAAVITARSTDDAQRKLRRVMIRTKTWMENRGLHLATHKTELLLITGRHIPLQLTVNIGVETITSGSSVKYLGLRLDPRLNFMSQIRYAASKAQGIVKQLSRLMANIGGPLPAKRRLLMEAANSVMLYGSEIWAETLRVKSRTHLLTTVQRMAALRITSSYRTVSTPAVLVIANIIPVDLLAEERTEVYKAKTRRIPVTDSFRRETIRKWQQRWVAENRGRWTARLIPTIESWIYRKFGEVNYYTTQMLSGHGYFREYLHKMGKNHTPYCLYEEENVFDDAEHTIFHCSRWHGYRFELELRVGAISVGNIVSIMTESSGNWAAVSKYIECVLRQKKKDLELAEIAGPGRGQT